MNMKKIATSLLIFIFIFSNAAAFAQMPVAVSGIAPFLGELSKIGVVAAIQGRVEVMTHGAAGRVVQSGEEIFIGDEVNTDAMGHLQILLLDETVFTIGPNSAITIDKFIYDPKTHVGNVEASITKGVFRYVSGKIAANKPENVSIKLPTATIGIRGTIVAGEVSATRSMAMLLGPGSRNETGATIGSFVMNGTGENSGHREHVNRTGFGVSVDQGGSLSGVFKVPESQLEHLTTALLPAQRQGPGLVAKENDQNVPQVGGTPDQVPSPARLPDGPMPGIMPRAPLGGPGPMPMDKGSIPMMTTRLFSTGENMGKLSGEQLFTSFQMMKQINMMGMLQNGLMQDSTLASQDMAQKDVAPHTTRSIEPTKMQSLIDSPNGVSHYQHFWGSFNLIQGANTFGGTLEASININFINDVIGGIENGKDSYVQISIPEDTARGFNGLTDNTTLAATPFGSTGGNAFFNLVENNSNFVVTIELQDIINKLTDGTTSSVDIAAQAKVVASYNNSDPDVLASGSGDLIANQYAGPTTEIPDTPVNNQ